MKQFLAIFLVLMTGTLSFGADFLIWNPHQSCSANEMENILIQEGYTGTQTEDLVNELSNLYSYRVLFLFPEYSDSIVTEQLGRCRTAIGIFIQDFGYGVYWENANVAFEYPFYRDTIFQFDIATCIEPVFTTLYGEENFHELNFHTNPITAPEIGGGDGCSFSTLLECPKVAVYRDTDYRAMLTSFTFQSLMDTCGYNTRSEYVTHLMHWLLRMDFIYTQIPRNYETSFKMYPNPFNGSTTIHFNLPDGMQISLDIYNCLGQQVANLYSGWCEKGPQTFIWYGEGQVSGIYLVRLVHHSNSEMEKIVLLK